ncbi:hypothetical protein BCR43DRAFT_222735 [Syncephalastrum racemosum]|uniref:UDENN domain-containing protein n=1 Tax=Syncephalastrum racemosum TaxID=13706 RepID=A0A1X2HJD1_SYNRA|nr:hypothetical protein BCR43DRAFT_222735 [Syncephalastrum racemosum]
MRAFGVVLAEKASLANVWVHGQLLKRLPTDPSRHELKEFMQKYHHQHRRPSALPSLPSPSVVDDNFPFFMAELGPQVFVLWKAALLRQRILFMTAPPVQEACNHVYNTCLLSAVPTKYNKPNIAKFYISVNEIPELMESTDGFGYVACTSDSIFETKEDLYDLLIKIPQDGDLARAHFHSVPGTPAPQHNAADFIRFRSAVRRIFDLHEDSNDLSRLLDRKSDFADAIGTATLQMLLWWYRSPRHHPNASQQQQNDENTSKGPSWARLFAGTNPVRKEEDQALLLEENEADATEINNNEVMHAVAARASTEEEDEEGEETPSSSRQDTSSLKADPLTQALTRYFESLSARLLSTLESMILAVDEDNQEVILTPQDLIELGLHPVADAAFVTALARLYFDRSVHVQEPDPLYLCKCGCCGPRKGGIQM